jgi:hypothetical protein
VSGCLPYIMAILDCYDLPENAEAWRTPYLNLDKLRVVEKQYGAMQTHAVLSLLDRIHVLEHSGNLASSSWLSHAGWHWRNRLLDAKSKDPGV